MIKRVENDYWVFYVDPTQASKFEEHKVGKWMYFFKDAEFADRICRLAVEEGAVAESKRRNAPDGVCCFYLHYDDDTGHRKILAFLLKHGLIQKTKAGRLYDISFKLDDQTRAGEYGDAFHSELKLSRFVDLDTGKILEGD